MNIREMLLTLAKIDLFLEETRFVKLSHEEIARIAGIAINAGSKIEGLRSCNFGTSGDFGNSVLPLPAISETKA
jgi:hypothetical protein